MAKAAVAVVGVVVLAAVAFALVEHEERAGPYDVPWTHTTVPVHVEGTYHARPAGETVSGVCLLPPCDPVTRIDLTFQGLPLLDEARYEATLDGEASAPIGPLVPAGNAVHMLRWEAQGDHSDARAITVHLAGQEILRLDVRGGEAMRIDTSPAAAWPPAAALDGTTVHLAEIGGVEISTVVKGRIPFQAPEGWVFHAWLEGPHGTVQLGVLEQGSDHAVLDARVERVPLEDQERVVLALRKEGAGGPGFPVLQAELPAH